MLQHGRECWRGAQAAGTFHCSHLQEPLSEAWGSALLAHDGHFGKDRHATRLSGTRQAHALVHAASKQQPPTCYESGLQAW